MLLGLLLAGTIGAPARASAHPAPEQRAVSREAGGREALQKAAQLVQQGRLDEADTLAQTAIGHPETRAVASSVLGTIRLQQKRLDESARYLEEAIRLEPGLLGAHLTLAEVHTLRGRSDLAADLYARALQLDPQNPAARFGLARAETEKGNHQRALELARPVLPAFMSFPEGLFVLATSYLATGGRDAALQLVEAWTRLPDVPPAWSIRFALLFTTSDVARGAVQVLERAVKIGPPSYELALNLAGAYVLNGQPAKALAAYDGALLFDPASLAALRQAARLAEQQGELERSLSYWIRAKKLEPDNPEVLLGFGRVCLKMDLLDDAEPALEKAAELRPGELPYQYSLAAARVGKRQFESAQTLLEKLVAERPEDPQLQYALGSVLYIQGNLSEAGERLKESIRLQPDQLAASHYLALVARDQGRDAEAIACLERLLERHPEHAASREALGGLLIIAGRYPEAETNLREAVRLNPRSVKANYQLGLLLARLGRKEEADKQLQLTKSLRQDDEANSRLQLRLLEPDR